MKEKVKRKPSKKEYEKYNAILEQGDWSEDDIKFLDQIDISSDVFEENGNHGLKNCLGEVLIKSQYQDFMTLSSYDIKKGDRVTAMQNGKWGVLRVNTDEEWLAEPIYDFIGYPNRITFVVKEGVYGVMDLEDKKFIIPLHCESVSSDNGFLFCNGIAQFGIEGKIGVIRENGEFTEALFDEVEAIEVGEQVKVRIGEEWGVINKEGKFDTNEDEAYYFMCD